MDAFAIEFENLVNSFTDVEELISFATFWDIHDLAVVRMRLFLLRNPQVDNIMDYSAQIQNDDDLELVLEYVREQKEFMQVQGRTETESDMQNGQESRTVQGASRNKPQPSHRPDMPKNVQGASNYGQQPGPSHRPDMPTIVQGASNYQPQPGPSHRPDMPTIVQGASNYGQQPGPSHRPDMPTIVQGASNYGQQPGPSHRPDMPTIVQEGSGDEPQPGPSHRPDNRGINYAIRQKTRRTYAKSAATDTSYEVKVDEQHHGQRLNEIRQGLHNMFDDVLDQARGDLAGNDLGRVVIQHDALNNPIVVPLRPWDDLNANTVMETIEKVLNSHENLSIDDSFDITVGSIELPKGGARCRITRLEGEDNSLERKRSIVTIVNNDKLCMARAISVSWAKLNRCSAAEWKDIAQSRGSKTNLELILEHRKVPESHFKHLRKHGGKEQTDLAKAFSRLAGVPLDRPASLSDIPAFEDVLGVRVMVVSSRLGNKFITTASTDERPCIYIYLVDDMHFHSLVNITGFFSSRYFCSQCLKHYNTREKHRCDTTCIICKRQNCPKTKSPVKCNECHMECRSMDCFQDHKKIPVYKRGSKKGQQSGPSQCQKWWKCPISHKAVNRTSRKIEEHQCGEYLCTSCEQYVLRGHQCFLRATPYKPSLNSNFIFFDFECSQDEISTCQEGYVPSTKACADCQSEKKCNSCRKCQNCKTAWCGRTTHRPNYVVAQSVCKHCINSDVTPDSKCDICGPRCGECAKPEEGDDDQGPCPDTCGFRQVTFQGEDTAQKFCAWLFTEDHQHFKVIAHNLKGYDGYFLLEYLIDNSMRPGKIIYNGSKIMYMTVERGLHMQVLDSLNFLPMKLADLPKAFGLSELKKGWFPHYFNRKENQEYVGNYPPSESYGYNFMGTEERSKFLEWYESVKGQIFDFRKEMKEYCVSDVDILRQACLKFRQLLISSTMTRALITTKKGKQKMKDVAIDPFDFVTIASVCMGVYKTKHLQEEWKVQLNGGQEWKKAKYIDGNLEVWLNDKWVKEGEMNGKITEKMFVQSPIAKVLPQGHEDTHSQASIQWLQWVAHSNNVAIQHALNGGEKRVPGTKYKLDGYCEATNTAYEYHGCVFHGCEVCFPVDREQTKHPYTGQSMSELYALTLKKKAYIERLGMKYVCIWEHSFKQQLQKDAKLRSFIQTLDITDRLDPRESFFGGRTNASQLYYKVSENEQIKYVDFTSLYPWVNKYCEYPTGHPEIITTDIKDLNQYFGIAKVKILPPRGLYHPVLPFRSNGKLKFPLCRTCADQENEDICTCLDENRCLVGVWCTPELQNALRVGYKVLRIYEVYHWNETTKYDPVSKRGGLFSPYINTFLKIKQEASGPPDWIKSDADSVKYVEEYFEKEGISLDKCSIKKNPGLRALSKLCLNSFWGKFGQRLNMRQTDYFHESEEDSFFKVFCDPMKHPQNFHIIADDMIQVDWVYKKDCVPEDNKTNIYLATFTTCWARLKLYSVLERLNRNVLYYDTDSIIFVSRPGQYDPPLGDYLGDLTNELKAGEHIVEFVSGGSKNYAYRTNNGKEVCKVRGFSLHFTNSNLINFGSVKEIVKNTADCATIEVTNPNKICRDQRKRKLFNREETKTYQMVYTKRRRLDNFDTVPYGY